MASPSLGHRAPLLWLVLPYAAGLAAGKTGLVVVAPVVGLSLAGLIGCGVLIVAGRHPRIWAGGLSLALMLAGMVSYGLHRSRLPEWRELPPREVRLNLRVQRIFTPTDDREVSGTGTILTAPAPLDDLVGQHIYFSLRLPKGGAAPLRTTELTAIGVIASLPESPLADSFDGFLANGGVNFKITRGDVVAETHPASVYSRFCAAAAERFSELLGIGVALRHPDLTGAYRGMMLGRQQDLEPGQKTLFQHSGTMHLFSISGLHIGVIAAGLQALLLLLRLPRMVRFWLGLGVLWLYVGVIGNAPSAIRAYVMVALLQAAFMLRVPGNALAALAAAALLVLSADPLQLFGASFQMSYGIVAALLLLGVPLADYWLERWPLFSRLPRNTWTFWHRSADDIWRALLGALGISIAAILFSMVAGVQYFALFTPGALLANLVVIPVSTFVILSGMGALLCGLAGFAAGAALCNHAAVLLLRGIDWFLRLVDALPGTWHTARFIHPWIGPAATAALLAAMLYGYAHRWEHRHGGWWPPFAVVALVLIFGVSFAAPPGTLPP